MVPSGLLGTNCPLAMKMPKQPHSLSSLNTAALKRTQVIYSTKRPILAPGSFCKFGCKGLLIRRSKMTSLALADEVSWRAGWRKIILIPPASCRISPKNWFLRSQYEIKPIHFSGVEIILLPTFRISKFLHFPFSIWLSAFCRKMSESSILQRHHHVFNPFISFFISFLFSVDSH